MIGPPTLIACVMLIFAGCTKAKEQRLLAQLSLNSVSPESEVNRAQIQPNFENEIAAGLALGRYGDHEAALSYFEKAKKRSPDSPLVLNNICAELNDLKRWKIAVEHCRQALAKEPQFQLAQNNLRVSEEAMASQQKVIVEIERKIDESKLPRDSLLIDLGLEFFKMGDYEKAIASWAKVKSSDPKLLTIVHNNLGSAAIMMKDFASAAKHLDRAKKLSPNDVLVKNNLAWLEKAKTTDH